MKAILGIFTVAVAFAASSVSAQEFKLGIVDIQRALNSVGEGKAAKTKLEKDAKAKQDQIKTREAKVEKLQKELEELQKKLPQGNPQLASPDILEKGRKLETEFRKEFEDLMKLRQTYTDEFSGREREATAAIFEKLRKVAEEVSQKQKFTMVVEKNSGLIYAASATDITKDVIDAYDSKFKSK